MKRLALVLALLSAPASAKEATTTIGVSCVVVASSPGVPTASIVTTRSCGVGCTLKVILY